MQNDGINVAHAVSSINNPHAGMVDVVSRNSKSTSKRNGDTKNLNNAIGDPKKKNK